MARRERDILERAVHAVAEQVARVDRVVTEARELVALYVIFPEHGRPLSGRGVLLARACAASGPDATLKEHMQ
jgi:hypothetical protein